MQDVFILLILMLSSLCLLHVLLQQKRLTSVSTSPTLPIAVRKATPVYCLFAMSLFWMFIQFQPLPLEWVQFLSPGRANYTGLETQVSHVSLSFYPWASYHGLLLSIAYVLLFILTLLLINNESRLRTLLYTLVILGVAQAAYGSLMTLSGLEKQLWFDKNAHLGVATGTLLNRNHLSNYLCYAAAASIGLLLSSSRMHSIKSWRQLFRVTANWLLGSKGFLRISLIIIVIGIILTRSRMGNVAFFTSLSTTALLWLFISQKFNKTTFILFGSLLVIDIFLMGSWFGIDQIAERLERTAVKTEAGYTSLEEWIVIKEEIKKERRSEPDTPSTHTQPLVTSPAKEPLPLAIDLRYKMMPYMINMANDFWLTGTGMGTFSDTFPLYKKEMTTSWYNEAHNDYLQFFIELGVIGCAPLMIIIILSLFKTWQTIRYRKSSLLVASGFTSLMVFTATGMHATVEYNLQRPSTASLFIIFLALPWATAHMASNKKPRRHNRKQGQTS